jgi:hypothetical protein
MRGLIMAPLSIELDGLAAGRTGAPARRTGHVAKTTTKTV